MKTIENIGIIGIGNVGRYIATTIIASNIKLAWFCSQHFVDKSLDIAIHKKIEEIDIVPDVILITTKDIAIKSVANRLAMHFKTKLANKYIIHTAGSYNTELLADCGKYGAKLIAAHPFQTFYNTKINVTNNNINNDNKIDNASLAIIWGIDCSEADKNIIADFIIRIAGKPYFLSNATKENKPLYHAASVVASNYLAATIEFASILANKSGIDKNIFLPEIINQTVKNSLSAINSNDNDKKNTIDGTTSNEFSTSKLSITGPIVRSDFDTIKLHLSSLADNKTLQNAYSYFGLGILELLKNANLLSAENLTNTKIILESQSNILSNTTIKQGIDATNSEIENKNRIQSPRSTLIVGLGNPGKEYANTRHNIGYIVAQYLIDKYHGIIKKISKITNFSILEINSDEKQKIIVAQPLTYMNNSGIAVKYLLNKYGIKPQDLVVVIDEYNFPVGKIQLKSSGSSGGHNGMSSIINELGTMDFYRLRCGIDKQFGQNELMDYVLSPFQINEKEKLDIMIQNAVQAIEFFISNDKGRAMSYINSGKVFEEVIN